MKINILILLMWCTSIIVTAQSTTIKSDVTNNANKLIIENGNQKKIVLINDYNPFQSFSVADKSMNNSIGSATNLSGVDKKMIISKFSATDDSLSSELESMSFSEITYNNFVLVINNFALVTFDLRLQAELGDIVGLRSQLTVFNSNGEIHTTLPENNNGYIEPTITGDGKYIAALGGGVSVESEFSLLELPNFTIYNTNGEVIYNLKSGSEFSILPPSTVDNMIIEVLQFPNNSYKYLIFFPNEHVVYERTYQTNDIGKLTDINTNGFVFKENGQSKTERFDKFFTKSTF